MGYTAVVKRKTDDELQHWKYIKRVKKNGKWRYYYDTSQLDKYEKGEEVKRTSLSDNTDTTTTTKYEQSDKLFDSTTNSSSSATMAGKKYVNTTTVKKQGKISRAAAKGEKWLFDKFFKKLNK